MTLLVVFVATWLLFGLLHYALCMKDWRLWSRTIGLQPHAWRGALVIFVPMVAFGPIGLIIREWTHTTFPHWYEEGAHE